MADSTTTVKFTGWVQGRAHANPPIEITGHVLPHTILTDVRVTGYFPALAGNKEVSFLLDELPKDDFIIGSQIVLTIGPASTLEVVKAPQLATSEFNKPGPEPESVVTTKSDELDKEPHVA